MRVMADLMESVPQERVSERIVEQDRRQPQASQRHPAGAHPRAHRRSGRRCTRSASDGRDRGK